MAPIGALPRSGTRSQQVVRNAPPLSRSSCDRPVAGRLSSTALAAGHPMAVDDHADRVGGCDLGTVGEPVACSRSAQGSSDCASPLSWRGSGKGWWVAFHSGSGRRDPARDLAPEPGI